VVLCCMTAIVLGVGFTWTGEADNDNWSAEDNWYPDGYWCYNDNMCYPHTTDDEALIEVDGGTTVIDFTGLSQNTTIDDLTISASAGATVRFAGDEKLTVDTLTIYGPPSSEVNRLFVRFSEASELETE